MPWSRPPTFRPRGPKPKLTCRLPHRDPTVLHIGPDRDCRWATVQTAAVLVVNGPSPDDRRATVPTVQTAAAPAAIARTRSPDAPRATDPTAPTAAVPAVIVPSPDAPRATAPTVPTAAAPAAIARSPDGRWATDLHQPGLAGGRFHRHRER